MNEVRKRSQIESVISFGNTGPTCMPQSGHLMDIEDWVPAH